MKEANIYGERERWKKPKASVKLFSTTESDAVIPPNEDMFMKKLRCTIHSRWESGQQKHLKTIN